MLPIDYTIIIIFIIYIYTIDIKKVDKQLNVVMALSATGAAVETHYLAHYFLFIIIFIYTYIY